MLQKSQKQKLKPYMTLISCFGLIHATESDVLKLKSETDNRLLKANTPSNTRSFAFGVPSSSFGIKWSQSRQIGKHESSVQFTDITWYGFWVQRVISHYYSGVNVQKLIFRAFSGRTLIPKSFAFVSGIYHWRVLPSELEGRASVLQRTHGDAAVKQPAGQQHLDPRYLLP